VSLTFYDTHCHFDFPPFAGDESASIMLAAAARVTKIIVPAVEAQYFQRVSDLAANYTALYAALGLHPIAIAKHAISDLELLEQYLQKKASKLIAIGEIGLDLYMDSPQFDKQQLLLDAQLKLARRYDLPVILHSRRSHDILAGHLKRHQLPRTGVVHGFAGSLQQAERFIALGYCIGVGGTITYPRASKTRAVMAALPLSSLVLETDAPDMPLNGGQGQPNRPERAALVYQTLCELRPEPAAEIADALKDNTEKLFTLS